MKIFKILGVTVLVLVVGFVLIGVFAPDADRGSGEESAAASVPASTEAATNASSAQSNAAVPTRLPDQCLDGICIGALPGELLKLQWLKKEVVTDSQLNDMQKQLLDQDEEYGLEKCVPRQSTTWNGKAQSACKMLVRSDGSFKSAQYRAYQTVETLRFFDGNVPSTCAAFKEPFEITGYVGVLEHNTQVKLRFDSAGKLRVYRIFKGFDSDSDAMSKTLVEKLHEKHPYLAPLKGIGPTSDPEFEGIAPWGGLIHMRVLKDGHPSIDMTGNPADFQADQQAACNVAKPVSVQ
ncbi:hypothetical protein [Flavobacterium sp.]|uniref:hypothetical protein n=1 Tax=Flavobacterium sp. TaxID=239 RepID=UPI003264702B